MDVQDLIDLLDAWLRSIPAVRGYDAVDAELRFRPDGRWQIAVALRPKVAGTPGTAPADAEAASEAGREDPNARAPVPPGTPVRAFADFDSLDDLEQVLGAVKPAEFYFEDERPDTGDPLRDR